MSIRFYLKHILCIIVLLVGWGEVFGNSVKSISLEKAQSYILVAEENESKDSDSSYHAALKANDICLANKELIFGDSTWKSLSMKSHYFIACYYGRKRLIKEMFAHYDSAWVSANELNSLEYIAKIGSNKGAELIIEGKFVLEGQKFLEKANNAAIKTEDKFLLVRTQTSLAYFFQLIGEHQTSIDYLRPNLKYLTANKLDFSELTCISIANSFIKLGQADSAVFYLENNLKLYEKRKLVSYTASLRTFLGKAYLIQGLRKKALNELKLSLAVFTNYKNLVWPETYQCLGQVYLELHQSDSSQLYYQKAIEQSILVKNENHKGKSYLGYSKALAISDDYQQAYEFFALHFEIFQTSSAFKLKNEIMRKNLVFEKEKQAYSDSTKRRAEDERDLLELENAELASSQSEDYKNAGIAGVSFSIIALGFAFVSVRTIRRKNRELDIQKKESGKQLEISQKQGEFLNLQNIEIEESFRYAERIQNTVLPKHEFEQYLDKRFEILYHTPNILSSDFYFYKKRENIKIFAVFSSKKKGVPGTLNNLMINHQLNNLIPKNFDNDINRVVKDLSQYVNAHLRINNKENQIEFSIVVQQEENLKFYGCRHDLLLERKDRDIFINGSSNTIGEIEDDLNIITVDLKEGDKVLLGTRKTTELYQKTKNKIKENVPQGSFEHIQITLEQILMDNQKEELCLLAIEA